MQRQPRIIALTMKSPYQKETLLSSEQPSPKDDCKGLIFQILAISASVVKSVARDLRFKKVPLVLLSVYCVTPQSRCFILFVGRMSYIMNSHC